MNRRPTRFALIFLAGSLAAASPSRAEDKEVKLYAGVFLPAAFTIDVGDTVTWTRVEGDHRIRSGAGSSDPDAGKLFDAVLDADHPYYSRTFEAPGIFSFHDLPFEAQAGPGSINVVPFTVSLEVVDLAFTPEEARIFEGDALEWVWIEGSHTITSGAGSADPAVGLLFDAVSNSNQPRFSFAFTQSEVVPYFCRPHEHMNMKGTVRVQRRFVRGDANGDGSVNIGDPVRVLAHLFVDDAPVSCLDAADANDDGLVDIADAIHLLDHLFLDSRSIPAPYPRPGADRTEDDLECW